MRKLIIAPIALLFVAALVLALGTPLFNGGTPVYAHVGDTPEGPLNCSGGAAAVVAAGGLPAGPGKGPSGAATAAFATMGPNALSGGIAGLHSIGCAAGL